MLLEISSVKYFSNLYLSSGMILLRHTLPIAGVSYMYVETRYFSSNCTVQEEGAQSQNEFELLLFIFGLFGRHQPSAAGPPMTARPSPMMPTALEFESFN